MRISILYFGAVRDLVGKEEETIEVPDVSDVHALRTLLVHRHDSLDGRLASVRIARNEIFSSDDERLADGDVIALIPPVAGG